MQVQVRNALFWSPSNTSWNSRLVNLYQEQTTWDKRHCSISTLEFNSWYFSQKNHDHQSSVNLNMFWDRIAKTSVKCLYTSKPFKLIALGHIHINITICPKLHDLFQTFQPPNPASPNPCQVTKARRWLFHAPRRASLTSSLDVIRSCA